MEKAIDFLRELRRWQSAQLAHHFQILGAGKMRIELRLLGYVTQPLAVLDRVPFDSLPMKENLAFGRLDQPHNHFQRGRFPGAVRPEISRDFAGPGHEADILNRDGAGVAFGNMAQFEHGDWTVAGARKFQDGNNLSLAVSKPA